MVSLMDDRQMLRLTSRIKYAYFLFRDFGTAFLLSHVVIMTFTLLTYWIDASFAHSTLIAFFRMQLHPKVFYYLFGLLLSVSAVGMVAAARPPSEDQIQGQEAIKQCCAVCCTCDCSIEECCRGCDSADICFIRPGSCRNCYCGDCLWLSDCRCPHCNTCEARLCLMDTSGCTCEGCCDCLCTSCRNPPNCASCSCDAAACPDCAGAGEGIFVVIAGAVAIVIVLFAVFGLIVLIISAVGFFQRVVQRHMHIIYKRQLADDFVVKDLASPDGGIKLVLKRQCMEEKEAEALLRRQMERQMEQQQQQQQQQQRDVYAPVSTHGEVDIEMPETAVSPLASSRPQEHSAMLAPSAPPSEEDHSTPGDVPEALPVAHAVSIFQRSELNRLGLL